MIDAHEKRILRSSLNNGDKVVVTLMKTESGKHNKGKRGDSYDGVVTDVTRTVVVVQFPLYRESFLINDIVTGMVLVEKVGG